MSTQGLFIILKSKKVETNKILMLLMSNREIEKHPWVKKTNFSTHECTMLTILCLTMAWQALKQSVISGKYLKNEALNKEVLERLNSTDNKEFEPFFLNFICETMEEYYARAIITIMAYCKHQRLPVPTVNSLENHSIDANATPTEVILDLIDDACAARWNTRSSAGSSWWTIIKQMVDIAGSVGFDVLAHVEWTLRYSILTTEKYETATPT